ncbi:phage minor tail U family protein, partial [Escherichia coli]|uniref:phage minor tail U family protein n=1 Tax=Escherichia coli TaxID=562 RepID=UPI001E61FBE7
YPVMSDVPALSDLITSMVASGYDYRRDDDAGLWSSAVTGSFKPSGLFPPALQK